MPLKILSLNCRGLHKTLKRKLIFSLCRKYDISCLQETYITDNDYIQWSNEWNGSLHYFKGTANSNGLIILINNKTNIEGDPNIVYSNPRILGIEITTSSKKCLIINIYSPNKKREKFTFFENLTKCMNIVSEKEFEAVFVCGDFNSVCNNGLDIISGAPHDEGEIHLFESFINKFNLHDTWRKFNPKTKDFTWHRKNPFTARRLDYLCNELTLSQVTNIEHTFVSCSDHKAIVLELKIEHFERGPGIWRFNNSLLNDKHFLESMNLTIDTFLAVNAHKEASLKWELLKNEIKSITTQYCNNKNQNRFSESKILLNEINKVNELLSQNPESKELEASLKRLQQKYEILSIHKIRGAQVRSRIKYIEDGEKNTKYFLGIEKIRGAQNTIQKLNCNNKSTINPHNILEETKQYYKALYSKDTDVDDSIDTINSFLEGAQFPKLSTEEALACDSELTMHEISYALSKLNNDSAPGSDGLSVPFYKAFWKKLQQPFLDSLKSSLERGELSVSQRRGIITLIHKGHDLDKNELGNWRPITLLNTDYKIFSKVIALRLQSCIDTVIHTNQKGFIKGRNISDLIRLIDDSILMTRQYSLPGLMVSVDFRKAFDSVSKNSILNALNIFKFGPTMLKFISVLINNNESSVRNGGWYSSFFPCQKGIRQGCCASPYFFLLVAEILSVKLKNSNQLKGISVPEKNVTLNKVLQYADDTSLILKNEYELKSALEIIEKFGTFSGLRLNRHKSVVLPLGGYVKTETHSSNVKWLKPNEHIKILGVYFSAENEASKIELNWKSKIQSMSRIVNNYRNRNISLYGKIILCKTFVLSKINYILQSLTLPETVLAEIDRIMFKFIWQKQISNKKAVEKINRTTLCQDVPSGGLDMISVKDQQKVYHVNWIKKIHSDNVNIEIVNSLTEKAGGIKYIMKCRLENPKKSLNNLIESEFWKQVVCTWSSLCYALGEPITSSEDISNQPIFLNSEIKYHKIPLHFPYWIKNNILYMHDLLINGKFLDYEEISNKLNRYPKLIFEYNALINAIPENWKEKLMNSDNTMTITTKITNFENSTLNLENHDIRKMILSLKPTTKCNEHFWMRKFNFEISKHYTIAQKATKESKLRLLHFKIMHNIYPTNILLCKMKIRTNILCDNCQVPDFIEHFFVECGLIEGFWKYVSSYIQSSTNIEVKLNSKDILLGLINSEHNNIKSREIDYINGIILLGKHCITKLRYGKLKNIYLIFDLELNLRKNY